MHVSVRFPPLLPAPADVKAKVDSLVPFSAEGLQQMAAPVSILDLSEDTNGARFGGAACSSQPGRMITVNSLEFPLPLWRAAISLKPSFKPLIVFLREFKEPMGVHSHSRLKRIITTLRQYWTSASDTPRDYYYTTMSMNVLILLYFTSSSTIKARCFTETLKRTPDLSNQHEWRWKTGRIRLTFLLMTGQG